MEIENFIKEIGGRKFVIELTGLSKGRISQWVVANQIPRPWVKFLVEKFPKECASNGIAA